MGAAGIGGRKFEAKKESNKVRRRDSKRQIREQVMQA